MDLNLFKQWPIDFVLSCIHEASHGVVAVCVGWSIGPKGIHVGDDCIAYLTRPVYNLPGGMDGDIMANKEPIINLAGRLAELKHLGEELIYYNVTDLKDSICEFKIHGPDELDIDEYHDDSTSLLVCYQKLYPSETNEEWFKRFRRDEQSTVEIINTGNRWLVITTLAYELMKCNGYLEQTHATGIIQELM